MLNLPFLIPYWRVRQELGLERSLDEAVFWSPNAASYLASPTHVHRWVGAALGLGEAKAYLFPGFVPVLLALFAFVPTRGREPPHMSLSSPPLRWLGAIDWAIALSVTRVAPRRSGGRNSVGAGPVPDLGRERRTEPRFSALFLLAVRLAVFGRAPFAFVPWLRARVEQTRRFLEPRVGISGGFYALLLAVSLWASFGPGAGLYTALYRLVPGFDFIRVPSRLTVLSVLGSRCSPEWERSACGAGLPRSSSFFSSSSRRFRSTSRPYAIEAPPMDHALAEMEPGPVAVFPIPDPRDTLAAASRHSIYMLHSTLHFLPLVNGYSGFTPERHDRLFRELASFPSEKGLAELEAISVRYAVLYRSGYGDPEWNAVLERVAGFPDRLALRKAYAEGRIYELTRGPRDRGSSEASRSRTPSTPKGSAP